MSYTDWLYKKIDENSHNEILAFLMMILGVNLLVGGLLVIQIREVAVVAFFSSQLSNFILGFILSVVGFCILLGGFILLI